jgi:hypothetical protein
LSLRQVSYDEQLQWMERSMAEASERELEVESMDQPAESEEVED